MESVMERHDDEPDAAIHHDDEQIPLETETTPACKADTTPRSLEETAAAAHAAGVPDSLPEVLCPHCQVTVKPRGRGQCPKCGRVLKQSFLARRRPVNVLRRQQLLDKLLGEYQPHTTMARTTCEMLAGVLEQLEVQKPGSQEHQRLVQLSQQLFAALEASRRPLDADPSAFPGVEQMPTSALERARDLLQRLATGDALTERELGQLDILESSMRGEVLLRELVPPAPPPVAIDLPVPVSAEPPVTVTAPSALPEPERCPYCTCSPCIGRDHSAFELLHASDPDVIKKKDAERTAEMMESLRRRTRSPFL
jgi:hypothetical protein